MYPLHMNYSIARRASYLNTRSPVYHQRYTPGANTVHLRVLPRARTNAPGRKLHVDLVTCNGTSCHEYSMPTMLLIDDDATFLNGEPGRILDMYLFL